MGGQITITDEDIGWSDVYSDQVSKGTRNLLDIATHYQFSPERVRLFRNGSREFPQYNSVAQFTDNPDHWLLEPDAGDSIHIESAESGSYVVNYELRASWVFQLTQSLSDGDEFRFGPYNGTDGWFIEQRGSDHDDRTADIIESSGGTETTLVEDIDLLKPTTEWFRRSVDFGWYAALRQEWHTTVVNDDGTVDETTVSSSANAGNRGPETGNLNLWIEVDADASTSNLGLEVGSMGMITVGDPTSLNRNKPQFKEVTVSGTADAWEPVYAVRIDPADTNVNCQVTALDILNYSKAATIELVVASVDADKTDASSWSEPEYHHEENTALQTTTSVSEVPDSTNGTQQDLSASQKFGGYTIASAVEVDGGNSAGSTATVNENRQEKKALLSSDVAVFLARTGTVDGTLSFVWDVDQNW